TPQHPQKSLGVLAVFAEPLEDRQPGSPPYQWQFRPLPARGGPIHRSDGQLHNPFGVAKHRANRGHKINHPSNRALFHFPTVSVVWYSLLTVTGTPLGIKIAGH